MPTRDDLRFGELDLEAPPVDQETMAPPFVPLFPSDTVVTPSQDTSARLSSIPNPVSASSGRESDVQIDESSLTPGSIQISPRDLTRSQGELARSSVREVKEFRVSSVSSAAGQRRLFAMHFVLKSSVDSSRWKRKTVTDRRKR